MWKTKTSSDGNQMAIGPKPIDILLESALHDLLIPIGAKIQPFNSPHVDEKIAAIAEANNVKFICLKP